MSKKPGSWRVDRLSVPIEVSTGGHEARNGESTVGKVAGLGLQCGQECPVP